MSRRQETRQRHRLQQIRNRFIMIGLVVAGAVLITFALVIPGIQATRGANATLTAAYANLVVVTPQAYSAKVDGSSLGDPNAPVKVTVYEDFRCSACKNYTQNLEPAFIHKYVETGKVRYSYGFYLVVDIIDKADASHRAANAALCAAAQNKFWEYHDTLYANQVTESPDLFTDSRLAQMAQNVGLDMNAFDQCYQARQYEPEIEKSMNAAQVLNIHSTPSVVVNGTLISSYSQLDQAVEAALAGE